MSEANKVHAHAKLVTADKGQIAKLLKDVRATINKAVHLLDLAVASTTVHAIVFGNVTPARDLLEIMAVGPESAFRTNALVTFFEAKGPFVWDAKEKVLNYDKSRAKAFKAEYAKDKVAFASALMTEPFYKFSRQASYQGFNFLAEMKKLMAKAAKVEKKHGDDKNTDLTGFDTFTKFYDKVVPANDNE